MGVLVREWRAEQADLEEQRRRRQQARRQVTPFGLSRRDVAKRSAVIRRAFPEFGGGTVWALANNPNLDAATLKNIYQQQVKIAARQGFANIGDPLGALGQYHAIQSLPGITDQAARQSALGQFDVKAAPKDWLTQHLGAVGDLFRSVDRTLGTQNQGALSFEQTANALKSTARGAFIALDTPIQFVNAAIRQTQPLFHPGNLNPNDLGRLNPVTMAEQTQAGQAIKALVEGRPVDVGAGILPDTRSATAQAARREAFRQSPQLIGGEPWTPGKFVANQFFDPNTDAFNIVSGGVDATVTLFADPANIAFARLAKARELSKVVAPLDLASQESRALTQAAITHEANATELAKATSGLQRAQRGVDVAQTADQTALFGASSLEDAQTALAQAQARHLTATETHAFSQGALDEARRQAVEAAGAYSGGWRSFLAPKTTTAWYGSGDGRFLIDYHVANGSPELAAARDAQDAARAHAQELIAAGAPDAQITAAGHAEEAARLQHERLLGAAIDDSYARYKGQGPIDFHREMAYAQTPDQVMGVFDRYLGTSLREFPTPRRFKDAFEPNLSEYRWAQHLPAYDAGLYPDSLDTSMHHLDLYLRNAKVPAADRAPIIGRLALARQGYAPDFYDVYTRLDDAIEKQIMKRGVSPKTARLATQFSGGKDLADLHKYYVDAVSGDTPSQPFGWINEHGVEVPSPHLGTEQLSTRIPFPDFRRIRRLTSVLGSQETRLAEVAQNVADRATEARLAANEARAASRPEEAAALERAAQGLDRSAKLAKVLALPDTVTRAMESGLTRYTAFWRRTHLARLGLAARIIMDGQASMWANGLSGVANDPATALAIIVGANPDSRVGRLIAKAASSDTPIISSVARKLGVDIADAHGVPFVFDQEGEFSQALTHSLSQVMEHDVAPGARVFSTLPNKNLYTVVDKGSEKWANGVADEIIRLHDDPLARRIASLPDSRAATDWLTGAGRKQFEDWVARPDRLARAAPDALPKAIGDMSEPEFRQMAQWYAETIMSRIAGVTRADPRFVAAIRDGSLAGVKLNRTTGYNDVVGQIKRLADGGWEGPTKVRLPLNAVLADTGRAAKQRITDWMMWNLVGRPTNQLLYSPVFRQLYWQRGTELSPLLSDAAKADLLHNIEDGSVKITKDAERAIRYAPTTPNGISLEQFDHLAKSFAGTHMGRILHDLGERRQVWDQLRILFPFGDAFQVVTTRWLKNMWRNPGVLHRAEQVIREGQQSGFLTKDAFGQEVFNFPGAKWVTDQLVGQPVQIQGALNGLNIAGEGLPGVGAVGQIAAAHLLSNKPTWDGVRNIIFPFGETTPGGTPFDEAVNALLPTWAGHALQYFQTPQGSKEFGNQVNALMNELASTGDYQLQGKNSHAETNRLYNDAVSAAKRMALVRGLASFVSPTAPIPDYLIYDKKNQLQEQSIVRDKYWKKVFDPKIGPDAAFQWLIDQFGAKNFLQAQGFTRSNGILPRTTNQWDFVRNNPWLADKYPETYGVLTPVENGTFDLTAYENTLATGARDRLDPKERVQLANDRLAKLIYDRKKADGWTPDQLRRLNEVLIREYDGYKSSVAQPDYNATQRRVIELERARDDARLARLAPDLHQALVDYFYARNAISEESAARFNGNRNGWQRRKDAQDLRDKLRQVGELLVRRVPRFAGAWDLVFSHEFTDTTDTGSNVSNNFVTVPVG